MKTDIFDLFAKRHSFYSITPHCPLNEEEIANTIKRSLELYPSPFNSQSSRVALLFGKEHQKFWEITKQALFQASTAEKHPAIGEKVAGFANGCGTVLYYTDTTITQNLEQRFPLYAANFKNWAFQSNAILQFMIWTAFANMNVGASLQHYNPLVNEKTSNAFDIPPHWELVAQMPFGGIKTIPSPHSAENADGFLIIRK